MSCHGGHHKKKGSHGDHLNSHHSNSHHSHGGHHQYKSNGHYGHGHSHGTSHWWLILIGVGFVVYYAFFK